MAAAGRKWRRGLVLSPIVLAGLCWFYFLWTRIGVPPVAHLRWIKPAETAYMREYRPSEIDYQWVPIGDISPHLQQAVVLAEDDTFFTHPGFSWDAVKTAVRINLRRKRFSHGASTITMQLARNLFLSPEKSLFRKLREILIALKIERSIPKERVLELYLNVVEWGDGVFGAEAASRHYFGKDALSLTKHEAAFLSALLPRPGYYDKNRDDPYLQSRTRTIESRL